MGVNGPALDGGGGGGGRRRDVAPAGTDGGTGGELGGYEWILRPGLNKRRRMVYEKDRSRSVINPRKLPVRWMNA